MVLSSPYLRDKTYYQREGGRVYCAVEGGGGGAVVAVFVVEMDNHDLKDF